MKKFFYLLIFVLFTNLCISQDFGKVGSKWIYESHYSLQDYTVFESVADSIILGKKTHQINIDSYSQYGKFIEGSMFVYQKGDTIFEYNPDSNEFHIMMRFDLNYNDTVTFNSYRNQAPYLTYSYRVYSVSLTNPTSSLSTKTIELEALNASVLGRFTFITLYEKTGFKDYFHIAKNYSTYGMFINGLRCYSDSNNSYNFTNGQSCEIIRYSFLSENNLNAKIDLFPNPSSSFLYINSKDLKVSKVQFFTLSGKLLSVEKSSKNSFDISELKNGIYLVKVHSSLGVASKKFIKN